MNITKLGHSCLLIEDQETRIIIDPGTWSTQQNDLHNIDVILITHAHTDHFDIDSLKTMIGNNPNVQIITNTSVSTKLEIEHIKSTVIEASQNIDINGVVIEGIGNDHAFLHSSIPCIQNTGYFIANRLFCPGDSFAIPQKPVEILALPVAGPWTRLQESIDYAIAIKPKVCFPIHDGILKSPGGAHLYPSQVLGSANIPFKILETDIEYEF